MKECFELDLKIIKYLITNILSWDENGNGGFSFALLSPGAAYDGEGNVGRWWTNETLDRFTDHIRCANSYYDNLTVDDVQVNRIGCKAILLIMIVRDIRQSSSKSRLILRETIFI